MFLDPGKTNLDFRHRATVKRSLRNIREQFPAHLTRLDGVLGFSRDADYYKGTIFVLPLRSEQQTKTENALSNKPLSIPYVTSLLRGHSWEFARQALLFTKLNSISANISDTSCNQTSVLWSLDATRNALLTEIHGIDPTNTAVSVSWKIHRETRLIKTLPQEFASLVDSHRLRDPIMCAYAVEMTTPSVGPYSLFAGLPLPITTSLPAHLNASFVLAEDRRSIRFDGDADGRMNLESRFNHFVLLWAAEVYARVLEIILDTHDIHRDKKWWRWWPIKRSDPPSKVFYHEFYTTIIPNTDRRICQTIVGQKLAPKATVIISTLDSDPPTKVLVKMQVPNLSLITSSSVLRCIDDSIAKVTPSFFREKIMTSPSCIATMYSTQHLGLEDISRLFRFLPAASLIGLQILPLADGTLGTIKSRQHGIPNFLIWRVAPRSLKYLPCERLLHPDFELGDLLLQRTNINVSQINSTTVTEIQQIVQEHVPLATRVNGIVTHEAHRMDVYWSELSKLELPGDVLQDFAMVPTSEPGTRVSLAYALTSEVFLLRGDDTGKHIELLTKLGASIIPIMSCKSIVRQYFTKKQKNDGASFMDVLPFLIASQRLTMFRSLVLSDQEHMATWCRSSLQTQSNKTFKKHRSLFLQVPMWRSLFESHHISGSDALMLPPMSSTEVTLREYIHHNTQITLYDRMLVRLNISPLTFDELRSGHLSLPANLPTSRFVSYQGILRDLIGCSDGSTSALVVPNKEGKMVPSDTLFSSREPLFVTAFPPDMGKFIHPFFQSMEHQLARFGLTTQINFNSFRACVDAFHSDTDGEDRLRRARDLFQCYDQVMPLKIEGNIDLWCQLDGYAFIPRDNLRSRNVAVPETLMLKPFNDIVTPRDVLRPDREAVAWTQRVLCNTLPSPRLLIAYPGFGEPTMSEVIEHLRSVALYSNNKGATEGLLRSLDKTYLWINDSPDSDDSIAALFDQCIDERIFLNVASLDETPQWNSAKEMFFGIERSSETFHVVKMYLQRFQRMLRLAGVQKIHSPIMVTERASQGDAAIIEHMMSIAEDLRQRRVLIDVIFVADDGSEYPAHRFYLAQQSSKFLAQFSGAFQDATIGTEAIQICVQQSAECLSAIFDFIYTGKMVVTDDANVYVEIFRLAHEWDLMEALAEVEILLQRFVDLDNYEILRELACERQANALESYCSQWEESNRAVIDRLKRAGYHESEDTDDV